MFPKVLGVQTQKRRFGSEDFQVIFRLQSSVMFRFQNVNFPGCFQQFQLEKTTILSWSQISLSSPSTAGGPKHPDAHGVKQLLLMAENKWVNGVKETRHL